MAKRFPYQSLLVVTVFALFALYLTSVHALRQLLAADFPPRCKCNKDAYQSPYRLSDPYPANDPVPVKNLKRDELMEYCYTILNIGGCDSALKCCSGKQGVDKIEIAVPRGRLPDCKPHLKLVSVNGKRWPFEFSAKDSLIRVTKLGLNATAAPGSRVCLWATEWADCNSPGWMCYPTGGACKVAVFNKERDCCPVSYTGDQEGASMGPPPAM